MFEGLEGVGEDSKAGISSKYLVYMDEVLME